MFTTYKIQNGDTFESISNKLYGYPAFGSLIKNANPAISILTAGNNILAPKQKTQAVGVYGNDIAIYIDDKEFKFWTELEIKRSIDGIDTFSFIAPFNKEDKKFIELFKPLTFKKLLITIDGEPLVTGILLSVIPSFDTYSNMISCEGYSMCGVLQDCTPPASMLSTEYNGRSLYNIATILSKPYGIKVINSVNDSKSFETVAAEPTSKIFDFLINLAQQRGIILRSAKNGDLELLQSAKVTTPRMTLNEGNQPLLNVYTKIESQQIYSAITGIAPATENENGGQSTLKNPFLNNKLRALTFNVNDVANSDLKNSVSAKLGRMFGYNISYTADMVGWRDSSNKLIEPNTTLALKSPSAMIYNEYNFIIRSVTYRKNTNSEYVSIDLMLEGAFAGEVPKRLPWD